MLLGDSEFSHSNKCTHMLLKHSICDHKNVFIGESQAARSPYLKRSLSSFLYTTNAANFSECFMLS
jgi:hypothetical protein